MVHLSAGGGSSSYESVQVLSVFVADTNLGEGAGWGSRPTRETEIKNPMKYLWARPTNVQLEYPFCQLFVELGHGGSPGVRNVNVLVVEDVFPDHVQSNIQPYIP